MFKHTVKTEKLQVRRVKLAFTVAFQCKLVKVKDARYMERWPVEVNEFKCWVIQQEMVQVFNNLHQCHLKKQNGSYNFGNWGTCSSKDNLLNIKLLTTTGYKRCWIEPDLTEANVNNPAPSSPKVVEPLQRQKQELKKFK